MYFGKCGGKLRLIRFFGILCEQALWRSCSGIPSFPFVSLVFFEERLLLTTAIVGRQMTPLVWAEYQLVCPIRAGLSQSMPESGFRVARVRASGRALPSRCS